MSGGNLRRTDWIGMVAAARVPDGRDMVDIDAETEPLGHAAARLPGLTAGIDASSGGSALERFDLKADIDGRRRMRQRTD